MTQQTSPFTDVKYGWAFGESGWNTGMDENLTKFSFLFDKNIDAIVTSLPGAVSGTAYFLNTDKRLYFAVNNNWYSSPVPKWFVVTIKTTGESYQFDGTNLVSVPSASELSTSVEEIEATLATFGTAALKDESYFATQAQLDVSESEAATYTDTKVTALRSDLLSDTFPYGVSKVKNAESAINLADFPGYVAGGDNTSVFNSASAAADSHNLELVAPPTLTISGDILLPNYFNGKGCVITGGRVVLRAKKQASVKNFTCTTLLTEGIWNTDLRNINVIDVWTITGYQAIWGTFWNQFTNIRCGQIVIDVRYQAVNENVFNSCLGNKPGVYGLLITDGGATSSSGIMEAHNNELGGIDTSQSLGYKNVVVVRNQRNIIMAGYAENGATVYGNFDIGVSGMTIDGQSPPSVTDKNWVAGMSDVAAATMGDSIPMTSVNACIGGNWQVRDANSKPPGFVTVSGCSVMPISNTPYGFTGAYGKTWTTTFSGPPLQFVCSTGYFSAVVWIYCPNGNVPAAITIDDGTTQSSRDPEQAWVNPTSPFSVFRLYRISGTVVKGSNVTITFFANTGVASSVVMGLGAAWVTNGKVAQLPSYSEPVSSETVQVNGCEIKKGIASQAYTTGTSVNITVTYAEPFRSGLQTIPTWSVKPAVGYEDKYIKSILTGLSTTGFTIRVYFTTDWTGDIYWETISK